ncbi:MAG TPA: MBL fold metallo-hydrolase [Thermoanaerobaculia bacterium]|jgi:glyoxylase-like metal-dependent hydrolase (beta-lactamase superfamily II)|nr:MBL fold metallo-hydrolase [Thermoanaerobaculia bacterium]
MRSRLAALPFVLTLGLSAVPVAAQSSIGVQKLADGVWAAQPERGANVGWFLYGDGVVAVDSGGDAAMGQEILKQIAVTTDGKPVRYLVLTHAHADHSSGARAFVAAGAQVICQENAAGPILSFITQASNDPADPLSGKRNVSPTLLTVSERLILFDGRHRADIQWLGPAHTNADLVVLLPTEKVLFIGDLAPNGRVPDLHLPDADPAAWAKTLPRLAAVPVDKMVPGHGTIGPKTGIADTLAYLRGLDEIVKKLLRNGTPEEYLEIRLREPDNRIPNVPLSEAHLKNAVAVFHRQKEKLTKPATTPARPEKAPTPRPTARRSTAS